MWLSSAFIGSVAALPGCDNPPPCAAKRKRVLAVVEKVCHRLKALGQSCIDRRPVLAMSLLKCLPVTAPVFFVQGPA